MFSGHVETSILTIFSGKRNHGALAWEGREGRGDLLNPPPTLLKPRRGPWYTVVLNMPKFREAREALLYAFSDNLISGEEFALLYDVNKSKNKDFQYWNYETFDLDDISDVLFCQGNFTTKCKPKICL